jgi:hypothetical protein
VHSTMDAEGIDPVAVYAALMSTLVRTVFAQPDAASAWAQHARVVDQLAERFPAAAELLADAAADLLAFTAFPAETGAIARHARNRPIKLPSVLVFVHFIKPAFTIGIESSFQILEIGSQWLHYSAPAAAGVFRSDTMIVI